MKYAPLSGEELGRVLGIDGGSARRRIRKAKEEYPDLPWYDQNEPKITAVRRGIGYFDMHHPEHDRRLWRNVLKFAADFKPDIWAFGGDNMDMQTLSHWIENKKRLVEGKRLKKDYADFNREVLLPLEAVLSEDAERIFMLGNHEAWVDQYLDSHPEMEGLIELREHLRLDGWSVYDYGEIAQVGKLHITHGTYTNIHSAMRTAQVFGRNVMYGHGHSLQTHTITTPLDVESHTATEIPCACHLNPSYRKNQPNSWLTGFATFYVLPNGDFNLFPVVAVNGKFVGPNGVLYE
jgi:hypothetical protein